MERSKKGSLTAVSLGLRASQLTPECRAALMNADITFYVCNNAATLLQLKALCKNPQDLQSCYAVGKPRRETYAEMTEKVLAEVRSGRNVCFAAYGHAGVFATPTHASIKQARKEGFEAVMLPGVSAEDCLFADLGIDPARTGCQSYEATDFMLRERIWDPCVTLVLWQVAVAGERTLPAPDAVPPGFEMLIRRLTEAYGPDQMATLYEAAIYPLAKPSIRRIRFKNLKPSHFHLHTTLVIKPKGPSPRLNKEFARIFEPVPVTQ